MVLFHHAKASVPSSNRSFILKEGQRLGFEFKYTDSPKVTKSMNVALKDLKLDSLKVIFPGKERFPLEKKIEAVGLHSLLGK